MATAPQDETGNVLVSAVLIGAVVMAISITVLWSVTHDIYLDAYYTIETFFAAPDTAASFDLAELAFNSDPGKFSAIVGVVILDNLSNMLVISFVIAAVLNIIRYADFEEIINRFRGSRMKGHVIVCGYNDVAAGLVARLKKKGVKVAVIDHDKATEEMLNRQGIVAITGKFTESEVLSQVSIANAREIVFTASSDIDNLVGAITAKRLNEKIRIMCRVSNDEIRSKMYRVGVDMCVLPEYLSGIEIGERLLKVAGL
ncbi:MAG: NAD-binding protein [Candidatus Micrarchaeota archaeon]|nr:NAD-binding protein [Candidatus Micrarchaeota archaeon]